jgi:hypothetical protein
MWTIKTGTDGSIVVNTFEGKFDTDILLNYLKSNSFCWAKSSVIWDFSKADVSSTSTEDIITIVKKAKAISKMSKGVKTAIVTRSDRSYGLAEQFVILAKQAGFYIEFQAFRNYADAKKWLLRCYNKKHLISRYTRKPAATML